MGKVINGQCDVAIGFISLQYVRTLFLSETKAYAIVPLVITVPPGEKYSEMGKFVQPFTLAVWIAIAMIFITANLVIGLVSYCWENAYDFVIGRNVKTPLWNMFLIVFGSSQHQLPKRNFARFILMAFILYWIILRSAYQGEIFKILKSSKRKPEIASVKEMMDNNYVFYLYKTLEPRMQSFPFYERRVVFPNDQIQSFRIKTLNPSFKGVVFNYIDQVMYQNTLNENFTFKICKQQFLINPIVFYFRKNHYLVEEVNARIDLLLANGIIEKIRTSYSDPKFLKADKETAEQKMLTIENFVGVFLMFGLCCLLATSAFALEMMTNNKKLKHLKKAMDYVQHSRTN